MEDYFTEEEKKVFSKSYSTAIRLKKVLLNMFNSDTFKEVDLLGLMLCDKRHKDIFFKVLNMDVNYINRHLYNDFSELIIERKKYLDKVNAK